MVKKGWGTKVVKQDSEIYVLRQLTTVLHKTKLYYLLSGASSSLCGSSRLCHWLWYDSHHILCIHMVSPCIFYKLTGYQLTVLQCIAQALQRDALLRYGSCKLPWLYVIHQVHPFSSSWDNGLVMACSHFPVFSLNIKGHFIIKFYIHYLTCHSMWYSIRN